MDRDPNQRLVEGLRSRFLAGTEQTALAYTYHTSDFVVTGNVTHPLGGNGPILVSKVTGTVEVVGTALPVAHYIREFEAKNAWAASGRFPPHYRNG